MNKIKIENLKDYWLVEDSKIPLLINILNFLGEKRNNQSKNIRKNILQKIKGFFLKNSTIDNNDEPLGIGG